jgi:hypothetical protein
MVKYQLSEHANYVLKERNIKEEWMQVTIENPDKKEEKKDGTIHFIKSIKEYQGRYLRVVVNAEVTPLRIITLFFDRRLGRQG